MFITRPGNIFKTFTAAPPRVLFYFSPKPGALTGGHIDFQHAQQ
jgi:hypothetical protein